MANDATGVGYRMLRGEDRVRRYDFHRPDKLSREHLNALRAIFDNLARFCVTHLSTHVRSAVKVSLVALDQMIYEEFTQKLHSPVILGITQFEGLEGKVGIEIAPAITFPLVERLLGSNDEAGQVNRPLTDIETAVISTVFVRVLDSVKEAFRGIVETKGDLLGIETSPYFTQFAPPNEMMVLARFQVELGQSAGDMTLALPYVLIEPFLPQLSLQQWVGNARADFETGQDAEHRSRLKQHLEGVQLPVTAQLGQTTIELKELIDLEVGDVVVLDQKVAEPLAICFGPRVRRHGYPGQYGNQIAVQVSDEAKGGRDVQRNPDTRRN